MLKKEVLRNKNDFNRIYRRGKSIGERYVVLFFIRNGLEYNRTAFLASKKVGNSVQRNRARRLMRECWRVHRDRLPAGYDFIIIARNSINHKTCQQVQVSVDKALKKSGITNKSR